MLQKRKKKHLSYVIYPECDISVSSKSPFEDVQHKLESPATVLQDSHRLTLSLHKALYLNKYLDSVISTVNANHNLHVSVQAARTCQRVKKGTIKCQTQSKNCVH